MLVIPRGRVLAYIARVPLATPRVASVWLMTACRQNKRYTNHSPRCNVRGVSKQDTGKGNPCQWHTPMHISEILRCVQNDTHYRTRM